MNTSLFTSRSLLCSLVPSCVQLCVHFAFLIVSCSLVCAAPLPVALAPETLPRLALQKRPLRQPPRPSPYKSL